MFVYINLKAKNFLKYKVLIKNTLNKSDLMNYKK